MHSLTPPPRPRAILPLAVTLCAVLLGGCTSVSRVALVNSELLADANISCIVAIEKDEVGISINPSDTGVSVGATAGGLIGGLVGALVDSSTNSKSAAAAAQSASPIRDALPGHRLDLAAAAAFSRAFSGTGGRPGLATVVALHNTGAGKLSSLVDGAGGDLVLAVFMRHLLSPDFTEAVLVADAVIVPKTSALKKNAGYRTYGEEQVPVLWRNKIHSLWRLPATAALPAGGAGTPASSRDFLASAWAANHAAALRTVLDSAAVEIAELAVWDIIQPAGKNSAGPSAGSETFYTRDYSEGTPASVRGHVVRRDNARVWLRAPDGTLHARPE